MKKLLFCLIIITLTVLCACTLDEESVTDNADVHAQYFEGTEKTIQQKKMYLIKLQDNLSFVPADLIVPKHLDGRNVDGLDNMAFGTYQINSVYVPDTLSYIADDVLENYNVNEITVPSALALLIIPYTTIKTY